MIKNLVIVESPAKAKTIEKFLGNDYKVMSSYGHIRDLKKKELSIDTDTLQPHYEVPAEKAKLVKELRQNAEEADNSKFVPITSTNEGDWKNLHDQAVTDIVVAHSWFRSLSGLDYLSGFSSERILQEYEIALNTLILGAQQELLEPIQIIINRILGCDASSMQVINRPPTRSKPLYMKVWEARKADGLDYDPNDESQQRYLAEITKYNLTHID